MMNGPNQESNKYKQLSYMLPLILAAIVLLPPELGSLVILACVWMSL